VGISQAHLSANNISERKDSQGKGIGTRRSQQEAGEEKERPGGLVHHHSANAKTLLDSFCGFAFFVGGAPKQKSIMKTN
jgi:hypothetical protein